MVKKNFSDVTVTATEALVNPYFVDCFHPFTLWVKNTGLVNPIRVTLVGGPNNTLADMVRIAGTEGNTLFPDILPGGNRAFVVEAPYEFVGLVVKTLAPGLTSTMKEIQMWPGHTGD